MVLQGQIPPRSLWRPTHKSEELTHARGETGDHTWPWWPERRILFTGDLSCWVAPNVGNPQKVQRYAAECKRRRLPSWTVKADFARTLFEQPPARYS